MKFIWNKKEHFFQETRVAGILQIEMEKETVEIVCGAGPLQEIPKHRELPKGMTVTENDPFLVCELCPEEEQTDAFIRFLPEKGADQPGYSIGGVFFAWEPSEVTGEPGAGQILCGKVILETDGFPKAGEKEIQVRKAGKISLKIFMDTDMGGEALEEKAAGEGQPEFSGVTKRILSLQIKMNRRLIGLGL